MRLLVVGGAGYIGSVVAARLLGAGHDVVVADNLSRGHSDAVPPGAQLIQVDLLDERGLERLFRLPFDGVLHFAALSIVPESVAEPLRYFRANVGGSLNLLEAMTRARIPRLVFSSTAAVYGVPDEIPIGEDAATRPANPYGASKLAVDEAVRHACPATGLGAVSLRYFNVAGAEGGLRERHDPETHLIPLVLQAAAGERDSVSIFGTDYETPDGTAVRDYIHVSDLADAHVLALEAVEPGRHEVYNLGNGEGFSVREVVDTARAVTGNAIRTDEAPRRAGDPPVLVASSERIRRELGWRPQKPGLATIVADAWAAAGAPHAAAA
jgi:UDP-glucose 4-epimerase